MFRISRLLLVALALLAAACGSSAPESSVAAPAATSVPAAGTSAATTGPVTPAGDVPEALAFSAATLGGGTFEGASAVGNDLLLWFWAPW
ncbi:hypothetical protein [Euzebya rosea]|uniref:hypothetical protein n=1 Tax=Euzebya rosea TaxID=2052804 RepID=UPI000D3ECA3F|nr:hypothetical protein [Euzebya rosea]